MTSANESALDSRRDPTPALTVGPDPGSGTTHLTIDELLNSDARDATYSTVTLQAALDALHDAWPVLRALRQCMADGGTLHAHYGSPVSEGPRAADIDSLLRLNGFQTIHVGGRRPVRLQVRKVPLPSPTMSCSVLVPCRNEVGNVGELLERLPELGTHTEVIFVDGSSTDGTPEKINALIAENPQRDVKLLRQEQAGGKAAAVFQGFDAAAGDVVMILDADMTVAPEDLPRFYLALAEGIADFANGTRMVYAMEAEAMPRANYLGNRAFGWFFSWVLSAHITDSLCGTKAILKRDWNSIRATRPLFGGHDLWGDFDLLLGAGVAGLSVVDVPVRYGARVSGESKMQPFRHGVPLLRTCLAGALQLKTPAKIRRYLTP